MKKQARMLLDKGIDSLVLAVEHFNRPWDRGRKEAVLILLDRGFELILKAAIIHKGGKIREAYERETIGFEKCVRKCLDDADVKFLSVDEGLTVQIINSLRDAAQHDVVELSEQELYLHAQAGVTLFRDILGRVFDEKLSDHVPERVLPVSPNPPPELHSMIETDFEKISQQLQPYSRDQVEAKAKLKALAIVESSLSGVRSQPSELEVNALARKVKEGKTWQELFPGIATLRVSAEGEGINVAIRITRKEGDPVCIVPEGTPGATVLAVRKIDPLSFYSLGLADLAEKVGLSQPKTLAVVKELDIQNSEDYFKTFRVGKSAPFKRYSPKALEKIREELGQLDMDEVWERHKPTGRRRR
ncbi:hypothetical protein J5H37_15215 [Stenotrophomonas maltophilia]|uniref:DUF3644 domain-containing protein n=1 Tax=Stenotrophomonas maltophilia TaxID=40324 RepID=UPI0019D47F11|nr:DUF3644 domain-containing protein [Stenotrophomonas maltophilia]MBN7828537.1 hypothetical protein [Stenotrophomonas maltophilia]MBN7834808.1 hypothetical protein [Stenotrophomonas maltophilia]MBN7857017.1 hypothetical protein [Stenotrophomonas maltophilia]MBN7917923.1 hypothetical protein [Stenotrophomonas maltophilia]MBO2846210.1 hypothetical protein [Stenotrophomonas maltophilia]